MLTGKKIWASKDYAEAKLSYSGNYSGEIYERLKDTPVDPVKWCRFFKAVNSK